ncbi:hypothetical protein ROZALSC1DRAFT_20174 [Rozella allomycis CSF55]|uniref:RGS domain-containing protein n=1 Tax=Rozella allomycis (strain CSF55) TaxID=988480 RepID=A0A4P9YQC1_ROZAC|nr:hypothetical protein ROZALSC1DRAFT_20174 [Rozella allomycis CSF55]
MFANLKDDTSIEEILKNHDLKSLLYQFSVKQLAEENIIFLDEYHQIKNFIETKDEDLQNDLRIKLNGLFSNFIEDSSQYALNIPDATKTDALKRWKEQTTKETPLSAIFSILDETYKHVRDLLKTSSILPFAQELKQATKNAIKVVIIGAGFCGTLVARLLDKYKAFQVVLIDRKPVFESTPYSIMAMVDPDLQEKILLPLDNLLKNGVFIQGHVTKLRSNSVDVNGTNIPFDYLVLGMGSSYKSGIKAQNWSVNYRKKNYLESFEKIKEAKKILIVGGGTGMSMFTT